MKVNNKNSDKSFLKSKTQTKPWLRNAKQKSKILKSVLKCSKTKINEKKKLLFNIINKNISLEKISLIQEKNDLLFNSGCTEAQTTYETEIENLFNNKTKKYNEILEKYDYEIFELQNSIEEEKQKEKNNNNNNSDTAVDNCSAKLIYDQLIEDKNNEIENLDKEYDEKFKEINEKYNENFEIEDVEDKSMIYRNQIFEDFKMKINDIVYPTNNKKVCFNVNDNSKNTSATSTEVNS